VISVAAELAGMHPQTLRVYERRGLLDPSRTAGGSRRYSDADIERLRRIQDLTTAGLNLEGVRRVLELEDELRTLRRELDELRNQTRRALEQVRSDAAKEIERVRREYRRELVPVRAAGVVPASAPVRALWEAGVRPDQRRSEDDQRRGTAADSRRR
jgi:MerR family transcriptional regulator/heat shock protein HspR